MSSISKSKIEKQLDQVQSALNDLRAGLNGKPFLWGDTERKSKEYILLRLGYALVSKSKLERGGHELKSGVQSVGKGYFGSPLRRYADLYVLDLQTNRTSKWYDLFGKGKALLEVDYQFTRYEYGNKPLMLVKKEDEDAERK